MYNLERSLSGHYRCIIMYKKAENPEMHEYNLTVTGMPLPNRNNCQVCLTVAAFIVGYLFFVSPLQQAIIHKGVQQQEWHQKLPGDMYGTWWLPKSKDLDRFSPEWERHQRNGYESQWLSVQPHHEAVQQHCHRRVQLFQHRGGVRLLGGGRCLRNHLNLWVKKNKKQKKEHIRPVFCFQSSFRNYVTEIFVAFFSGIG